MYTIFRSFILNIHGGCCLFSHITIKTNKKIKKKANTSSAFNPCWSSASTIYQNNLAKERSEKKCGAHTHVHQLSRFSSQYSRRLLSILAQPNTKQKQKNTVGFHRNLLYCFLFSRLHDNLFFYRSKHLLQKKNAEHTRMHTIFRNFLTQYSRRLLSILARKKN